MEVKETWLKASWWWCRRVFHCFLLPADFQRRIPWLRQFLFGVCGQFPNNFTTPQTSCISVFSSSRRLMERVIHRSLFERLLTLARGECLLLRIVMTLSSSSMLSTESALRRAVQSHPPKASRRRLPRPWFSFV